MCSAELTEETAGYFDKHFFPQLLTCNLNYPGFVRQNFQSYRIFFVLKIVILIKKNSYHLLYSAPQVSLYVQVNNLHGKDLFPLL